MRSLAVVTLFAMGLIAPARVSAQETEQSIIRGVVVADPGGEPLGGAWIELGSTEEGVLSDTAGRFILVDVPTGPYFLIVQRLGYRSEYVRGQAADSMLTVRMSPEPIALEGLRIVFDRFKRRRNATPMSVRLFDEMDLLRTPQRDVVRFLRSRGLYFMPCRSARAMSILCLWRRGRLIEPRVYVDERRAFGLDELRLYRPDDFYMVEVYGRGAQIRAYTRWYMNHAAKGRLHPIPLSW